MLREGDGGKDEVTVTEEEVLALEGELRMWKGVEGRRMRIREEMWGVVRDGLPEGKGEDEVRVSLLCSRLAPIFGLSVKIKQGMLTSRSLRKGNVGSGRRMMTGKESQS